MLNGTSAEHAGIYDVPEAARYLKASAQGDRAYPVSSSKLIRWLRNGLASPGFAGLPGRGLLIGFEDLVSLRIVAALLASGVTWREIRRTEEWLRAQTGMERPFATEYLWTGQGQVFVEWSERLTSGSRQGQIALGLLENFLLPVHGLLFSEETGAAFCWEPRISVLLNPMVQFGSPCIKGTRIPTRTISGMIESGDAPHWVADAYGISIEEVEAAHEWETHLRAA